jgi:hypothetical protein
VKQVRVGDVDRIGVMLAALLRPGGLDVPRHRTPKPLDLARAEADGTVDDDHLLVLP